MWEAERSSSRNRGIINWTACCFVIRDTTWRSNAKKALVKERRGYQNIYMSGVFLWFQVHVSPFPGSYFRSLTILMLHRVRNDIQQVRMREGRTQIHSYIYCISFDKTLCSCSHSLCWQSHVCTSRANAVTHIHQWVRNQEESVGNHRESSLLLSPLLLRASSAGCFCWDLHPAAAAVTAVTLGLCTDWNSWCRSSPPLTHSCLRNERRIIL